MELKQYLLLARRWWLLILLLTLLGGGAALGTSFLQEPVYEASTTVLINQAPGSLPDAEAVLSGQRVAATYAELMLQRPVLEKVIANLSLDISPDDLEEQLTVTPVRDTNLLVLNVRDSNPNRAAAIANEVVSVFITQNVEYQSSRYAASIQALESQIAQVESDIARTEGNLEALGDGTSSTDLAERNRLEELLTENRRNYAMLVQSYEQVRLAEAQTTDKITVVETALAGKSLTSPARNAVLGALVGAMLAAGAIFLIEYLRETVKTDAEAEQLTGAPTLGMIGTIRKNGHSSTLVTSTTPRSPLAEAYRVLRANIEFAAVDNPIRTLVITSSSPLEGKSTTAANLAVALAQSGKQIILVDADLRRPTLHRLFDQQSNNRGLTTALLQEGGGNLEDCVIRTNVDNLYLVPSGPLPPNPADLLGSRRMAALIERFKAHADIVLFDSPPLLAVADSALLARHCDAALLVVLADSTRSNTLRRASEQLQQSGAHLAGLVFNKVSSSHGGYYYHYYSS